VAALSGEAARGIDAFAALGDDAVAAVINLAGEG
jgi:hypothetical protein